MYIWWEYLSQKSHTTKSMYISLCMRYGWQRNINIKKLQWKYKMSANVDSEVAASWHLLVMLTGLTGKIIHNNANNTIL